MIKLILILVSFAAPKVEGEKVNRADVKKQIMSGCVSMSEAVADKKQAICKCIVDNFDNKKINDHELKVLSANYKQGSKDTGTKEVGESALQSFDYEVATACIENPNWKIKDKE